MLFDQAPLGAYFVDADFRIHRVNAVALPLFADIPDVLGRDFDEVAHLAWTPSGADEVVRLVLDTLQTGQPASIPDLALQRRESGIVGHYDWRIGRMALPEGGYGVLCCFQDISAHVTARRAAEETAEELRSELAAMEQLQRISTELVQEDNAEALYQQLVDAAMVLMHADAGSMQAHDPDRNELRLLAKKGFHPVSAEFFQHVTVDSATTCGMALRTGTRVIVPDVEGDDDIRGTSELQEFRRSEIRAMQSTPLRSRSGSLLGMISTHWRKPHRPSARDLRLLDVLARQAADFVERTHAEEALREADRRKDEFLAMLAHELRNPLGAIHTAAQVVWMAEDDVPTQHDALGTLDHQVDVITQLVDDLLDVSRVTQGKIELKLADVDLTALARQTVETFRGRITQRQQTLTPSLPGEPLWVHGDRVRLEQVIGNLLSNAIKYTPPDGHIWLDLTRDSGEAVLRVRDNGRGMQADALRYIFDLFWQGEQPLHRPQSGLGIGLPLVKSLVEMHQGTVTASSAGIGMGSEFIVRLPTMQAPARRGGPREAGPATAPDACLRVLVVDDNADMARMLRRILSKAGHETRTAASGPEGLAVARDFQPDVVLLDIGLPDMDGYEVARRLRREDAFRNTVLIALTGYGMETDRFSSQEAGFDHHLLKPVDLDVLHQILTSVAVSKE